MNYVFQVFGKGVYFADCSSKSAQYCFVNRSKEVGLILLCEVEVGDEVEKTDADYDAHNLPPGKHSTKGVGKFTTNPATWMKLDNGTIVPVGKVIKSEHASSTLLYNEYIVYDTAQIKCSYLVKVSDDLSGLTTQAA
jgi:poly [ADP-ribose] polymerase